MSKNKAIKKLFLICILCFFFFSLSFSFVGAACDPTKDTCTATVITNPLQCDTIQACIGNIIQSVLGIVGSLSLVMFIYGGFTWMLSGGSEQRVKKGKDILVWATLGLVIIFTSYAILKFVFEVLEGST